MKQPRNILWRVGAAMLAVSFWTSAIAFGAPAVKNVRTSQTKETIRVVADLTEKTAYDAYWQERENDYIVRIDDVTTGASLAVVKHPLLAKTEVIRGNDGALYFVFDMKEKMTAKTFMMDDPTRLVIDFTKEGAQPAVFAPAKKTAAADQSTPVAGSSTAASSAAAAQGQSALTDVKNVRIYHGPDKVRTVFDMSAAAAYETSYQSETGVLTIRMKSVSAAARTIPAPKAGDVLKSVTIMADGSDTVVRIQLKAYSVYNVFSLKEPHRIVVDALKEYQTEKKSLTE